MAGAYWFMLMARDTEDMRQRVGDLSSRHITIT